MKRNDGLLRTALHYLGIYRVYTRLLESQIKKGNMPKHIGVILDGNRRWAQERDYPEWMGHALGADRVENLLEWCLEYKIQSLTLYVLSTENLSRDPEELRKIFKIIEDKLDKLIQGRYVHKHRVHVKAMGNIDILPEGVRSRLLKLEEESAKYNDLYLNFAIAYGGRMEILHAVRKIASEVSRGELDPLEIDEKKFSSYLFTSFLPDPDPDLIIRTSGEVRLSGFLLWQSAYSELVFLDVYWPGFRKLDFLRAIRTYQNRQRRFGR
jgi:tritrans,polycis-undecaprenyl-diphosphate synthase [geranylgeranyl-diphosphate specific]